MIWTAIWDRDRGDPWGPGLPGYFKYRGGCSGKGSDVGSLQDSGVTSWVGLCVGIAQNIILHRERLHSGSQLHIGPDNNDGCGKDVR